MFDKGYCAIRQPKSDSPVAPKWPSALVPRPNCRHQGQCCNLGISSQWQQMYCALHLWPPASCCCYHKCIQERLRIVCLSPCSGAASLPTKWQSFGGDVSRLARANCWSRAPAEYAAPPVVQCPPHGPLNRSTSPHHLCQRSELLAHHGATNFFAYKCNTRVHPLTASADSLRCFISAELAIQRSCVWSPFCMCTRLFAVFSLSSPSSFPAPT